MSEKKMTFEESLRRLDEILETISNQSSTLDKNLSLYHEASEIIKELEEDLKVASEKVEKIVEIK